MAAREPVRFPRTLAPRGRSSLLRSRLMSSVLAVLRVRAQRALVPARATCSRPSAPAPPRSPSSCSRTSAASRRGRSRSCCSPTSCPSMVLGPIFGARRRPLVAPRLRDRRPTCCSAVGVHRARARRLVRGDRGVRAARRRRHGALLARGAGRAARRSSRRSARPRSRRSTARTRDVGRTLGPLLAALAFPLIGADEPDDRQRRPPSPSRRSCWRSSRSARAGRGRPSGGYRALLREAREGLARHLAHGRRARGRRGRRPRSSCSPRWSTSASCCSRATSGPARPASPR